MLLLVLLFVGLLCPTVDATATVDAAVAAVVVEIAGGLGRFVEAGMLHFGVVAVVIVVVAVELFVGGGHAHGAVVARLGYVARA